MTVARTVVDTTAGKRATNVALGEQVPLPAGKVYDTDWAPVAGATSAVVDAAALVLTATETEDPPATMAPTLRSGHHELAFNGARRLRRLKLANLASGDTKITEPSHLAAAGVRLVVLAPDGPEGQMIPRFAVPPLPGKAFTAGLLGGASLAGGLLKLPDSPFAKIGIVLVGDAGADPGSFVAAAMTLGDVTVVSVSLPTDLAIDGPDGKTVWQHPGELLAEHGPQTVDLRVALAAALKAKVAKGEAPKVAVKVRGSKGAVRIQRIAVRGALLRAFPGVVRSDLAGEPRALALAGPALAAEAPSAFTADLTVKYLGRRLATPASAPPSPLAGTVVAQAPLLRSLPPVGDHPLTAVGLYGRAPEPCELSVWTASNASAPSPGVASVEPGPDARLTWVNLPPQPPGAVKSLAVRANSGRFFWAAAAGVPMVQLVVEDADPGGRPLRAGGKTLLAVNETEASGPVTSAAALPAAIFTGDVQLESDLFLTVDLADLTLRYER
jgi:hypothetical protein